MNDELTPTAGTKPTPEALRLRNRLGGAYVEDGWHGDNLGIVLCTYFSDHMDRPEDDPDTEEGWGQWVIDHCNAALDLIAKQLAKSP